MNRVAQEVAEASRITDTELPNVIFRRPTQENALVDVAKKVQRLSTKCTRLRRELKRAVADLRAEKRNLRALTQAIRSGRS